MKYRVWFELEGESLEEIEADSPMQAAKQFAQELSDQWPDEYGEDVPMAVTVSVDGHGRYYVSQTETHIPDHYLLRKPEGYIPGSAVAIDYEVFQMAEKSP